MESFANWAIVMTGFMFVLYIAIAGITLSSLLHLTNAQWRYEVRDILVSGTALFPLGFVLLVIIMINAEYAFPWMTMDFSHYPLNAWHDTTFFITRQIVAYLAVWAFAVYYVSLQKKMVKGASEALIWRYRNVSLLVPFVYVLYGTLIAWDFEMTQWPRWYSSVYGAYHFVSNFQMFLAFCIVSMFVVNKFNMLKRPTHDYIFNYYAQILLAFCILFTYFFFVQYLVMWYGNLPQEITRYHNMMEGPNWFFFWAFFFMKSFIPFLMLIFTTIRHSPALMLIPAVSIIVGTSIERFMWIISPYADDITHNPWMSWKDHVALITIAVISYILWSRRIRKDGLVKSPEERASS